LRKTENIKANSTLNLLLFFDDSPEKSGGGGGRKINALNKKDEFLEDRYKACFIYLYPNNWSVVINKYNNN